MLMTQLRQSFATSTDVVIPMRYITRPQRLGDDLIENRYLSPLEFQEQVKEGKIPICWTRKMEGDRVEHYGFEKTDPQKLALYSANNDFCRRISSINKLVKENAQLQGADSAA